MNVHRSLNARRSRWSLRALRWHFWYFLGHSSCGDKYFNIDTDNKLSVIDGYRLIFDIFYLKREVTEDPAIIYKVYKTQKSYPQHHPTNTFTDSALITINSHTRLIQQSTNSPRSVSNWLNSTFVYPAIWGTWRIVLDSSRTIAPVEAITRIQSQTIHRPVAGSIDQKKSQCLNLRSFSFTGICVTHAPLGLGRGTCDRDRTKAVVQENGRKVEVDPSSRSPDRGRHFNQAMTSNHGACGCCWYRCHLARVTSWRGKGTRIEAGCIGISDPLLSLFGWALEEVAEASLSPVFLFWHSTHHCREVQALEATCRYRTRGSFYYLWSCFVPFWYSRKTSWFISYLICIVLCEGSIRGIKSYNKMEQNVYNQLSRFSIMLKQNSFGSEISLVMTFKG